MNSEERLSALDDRFVAFYEAARRKLLDAQKARGLIVVTEDYMLVYHGGGEPRRIGGLRPPLYEKLKTVSHVPLSLYCILLGHVGGDGDLPDAVVAELKTYRAQVAEISADLDLAPDFDAGVLPHRIQILDRAFDFFDRVIADGRVTAGDLGTFFRENLPDINAGFATAAKLQLDACHAIVMDLKETEFAPEEWEDLRVVILGPHMAHKDQNFLQYFSALLHTPKYADKRVVYFEGEDVQGALELMGTTLLDRKVSQSFFHNESRLHRDVLGDATATYLKELLPD